MNSLFESLKSMKHLTNLSIFLYLTQLNDELISNFSDSLKLFQAQLNILNLRFDGNIISDKGIVKLSMTI